MDTPSPITAIQTPVKESTTKKLTSRRVTEKLLLFPTFAVHALFNCWSIRSNMQLECFT